MQGAFQGLCSGRSNLYYDANGGSDYVFNPYIAKIGDSVEVIGTDRGEHQVDSPDWDKEFLAWNTEPDGTGKGYKEWDSITFTAPTTTLYALWANESEYSIIESAALTLSGEISVNIVISPTDVLKDDENAYMLIKGPNDKEPVKQLLKDMPRDDEGSSCFRRSPRTRCGT